MFGISGEHLLVLLVILLVFGPKRLPDLGNSLGRTLRNFKDALNSSGANETARPLTAQTASQQLPPVDATAQAAPQPQAETRA